jgi:ketol-acid reductoisomerase
MQIYHDSDADLSMLSSLTIAVIGYGNQGRAQALNLRDSGLSVIIGNRVDEYAAQASADGFSVFPIDQAARQGQVIMLLIPDEIMPGVFTKGIAPHLAPGKTLVFASGYNLAFDLLAPPPGVDVVVLAPRMIGAGVRDLYLSGRGFPSFFAIAQDASGNAKATVLALAKAIGSTRAGVVEVSVRQEAELDLFTEQCFGPAFGQVLMSAVNLLLDEGYPPEAVLLELYMSGEFSYTLAKIAEMGMIEQTQLHSRTSQYGSISRGLRFMLPEIRQRMQSGLQEIRSGEFAREWAAEQANGCPTLETLQETARSLPLYQYESQLRAALGNPASARPWELTSHAPVSAPASPRPDTPVETSGRPGLLTWMRSITKSRPAAESASQPPVQLNRDQLEAVLQVFVADAQRDPALLAFAAKNAVSSQYILTDVGLEFFLIFTSTGVAAGMGAPAEPAQLQLETSAATLDGMFTGLIDAPRAALSGKLQFTGDTRQGLSLQRIQADLRRLYQSARAQVLAKKG